MTAVKFCGLTQPADAAAAAALGASYVGVIFAGGPRQLTPSQARDVLAPSRGSARAVGVFGAADPDEIARMAAESALDVVQLHGDPGPVQVEQVRRVFGGRVWAAYRARESRLPPDAHALFDTADAVVLDAFREEALGGTGATLDWAQLRADLAAVRGRHAMLVLAGGLRAGNVGEAIRVIAPDLVDVSSGVEHAPAIKDHNEMRAFADAVRAAAATGPRS